jgi:hypothetical protein
MEEFVPTQTFFGMNDYRDLYFKCHQDLKELQNSDPRRKSYAIFNLVVSLNHMFDWFLNDLSASPEMKIKCMTRFNPYKPEDNLPRAFRNLYESLGSEFPRLNEDQYLVRCVGNKAKHWKASPTTEAHKADVGVGAGSQYARVGAPWMQCGVSTISIVTYLVEDGGEFYDMKLVCSDLHQEWGSFLREESLFVMSDHEAAEGES